MGVYFYLVCNMRYTYLHIVRTSGYWTLHKYWEFPEEESRFFFPKAERKGCRMIPKERNYKDMWLGWDV